MLEKIGTPGFETLSRPQYTLVGNIKTLMETNPAPVIAEIGIGIGATTRAICEAMDGRGVLHIFDFANKVEELADDLRALGYSNVTAHGNTSRYWDSYHWSLVKLYQAVGMPIFDYIYLDGAHTVLHDLPAFFLSDKLLKVGGVIELDDYSWYFGKSAAMKDTRHKYMTSEQEQAAQVKIVVDMFVEGNKRFEPLQRNRSYRKLADA